MIRTSLLAAAALFALAAPSAYAATSANAGASSSSGSSASASSSPSVTSTTSSGAQAGASNAGNSQVANFDSPAHQSVKTAPPLGGSTIITADQCALPVAGGVSVMGWGAFGGVTRSDRDCQIRADVDTAAGVLKDADLAKEVACNIKAIKDAYARLGRPCK